MGFSTYLRDRWRSLLLALGLLTVFLTVLLLFQLPLVAVGYAAVLCGTIYLGAGIWDLTRWQMCIRDRARMIITAQNGTIQAANRRKGGACFTIRFYK